LKVLIVEDSPELQTDLREVFARLAPAAELRLLTSESELMDCVSSMTLRPDIVILDVNLRWCTPRRGAILRPPANVDQAGPIAAGLRCLGAIRNDPVWSDVPVILHSVRNIRKLRAEGFQPSKLNLYYKKTEALEPVVHLVLNAWRTSPQTGRS
jgi:CheY-like chemotaxis protein